MQVIQAGLGEMYKPACISFDDVKAAWKQSLVNIKRSVADISKQMVMVYRIIHGDAITGIFLYGSYTRGDQRGKEKETVAMFEIRMYNVNNDLPNK